MQLHFLVLAVVGALAAIFAQSAAAPTPQDFELTDDRRNMVNRDISYAADVCRACC